MIAARILTAYYFVFLLIILPLLGLFETTKPLPNSISEAVLPTGASAPPARRFRRLPMNAHRSIVLAVTLAASLSAAALQSASAQEVENAAAPDMVVPRPVRLVRSRAASARLQDLSRGLFELPQPQASGIPQSRHRCLQFFSEAQAAAIASTFQVTAGPNDQGEMFQRPGKLADYFPPPFANDQAARNANGRRFAP